MKFGRCCIGGLVVSMAAGCLLPSYQKIQSMNREDRALVVAHAVKQLDCPEGQLHLRGLQNTMGRVGIWKVEGCSQQAKYRVIDGMVHAHVSPGDEPEAVPDTQEAVPDSQEAVPDTQEAVPDSQEAVPDGNQAAPSQQ